MPYRVGDIVGYRHNNEEAVGRVMAMLGDPSYPESYTICPEGSDPRSAVIVSHNHVFDPQQVLNRRTERLYEAGDLVMAEGFSGVVVKVLLQETRFLYLVNLPSVKNQWYEGRNLTFAEKGVVPHDDLINRYPIPEPPAAPTTRYVPFQEVSFLFRGNNRFGFIMDYAFFSEENEPFYMIRRDGDESSRYWVRESDISEVRRTLTYDEFMHEFKNRDSGDAYIPPHMPAKIKDVKYRLGERLQIIFNYHAIEDEYIPYHVGYVLAMDMGLEEPWYMLHFPSLGTSWVPQSHLARRPHFSGRDRDHLKQAFSLRPLPPQRNEVLMGPSQPNSPGRVVFVLDRDHPNANQIGVVMASLDQERVTVAIWGQGESTFALEQLQSVHTIQDFKEGQGVTVLHKHLVGYGLRAVVMGIEGGKVRVKFQDPPRKDCEVVYAPHDLRMMDYLPPLQITPIVVREEAPPPFQQLSLFSF